MMMAWTLFSFLCQDMLGKITLRIGKYKVSARREPFPVMLPRGLSWIPPRLLQFGGSMGFFFFFFGGPLCLNICLL